jgi:hypothetical protein
MIQQIIEVVAKIHNPKNCFSFVSLNSSIQFLSNGFDMQAIKQ